MTLENFFIVKDDWGDDGYCLWPLGHGGIDFATVQDILENKDYLFLKVGLKDLVDSLTDDEKKKYLGHVFKIGEMKERQIKKEASTRAQAKVEKIEAAKKLLKEEGLL